MPAMHYVRTRSGYGPAIVPERPAPPPVRVRYYIPTPPYMRADGEQRRSLPIDYVGYHAYIARTRGR